MYDSFFLNYTVQWSWFRQKTTSVNWTHTTYPLFERQMYPSARSTFLRTSLYPFNLLTLHDSFFRITPYNGTPTTHAQSPLWTHASKPYLYEHHLRRLMRYTLRLKKSPQMPRDGTSPTAESTILLISEKIAPRVEYKTSGATDHQTTVPFTVYIFL
jgi:hypothetical protein